jgi:hypothetical protein
MLARVAHCSKPRASSSVGMEQPVAQDPPQPTNACHQPHCPDGALNLPVGKS